MMAGVGTGYLPDTRESSGAYGAFSEQAGPIDLPHGKFPVYSFPYQPHGVAISTAEADS